MLLLLISLIAGVLTVLAPCVLPLLPVIIGGSVGSSVKDKFRPYVIAVGLAGSLVIFTLLLKVSTLLINVPANTLNIISGSIIIVLGLVSIAPELWEKMIADLNWQALSQRLLGKGDRNKDKYIGPLLVGVALGPVFASCSPTYAFILASVLPHSFASGLVYLLAYVIGLVLALLGLSLAGRKYIKRFSWAVDTHSLFRRLIGVIFLGIGIIIISGHEVSVETWVANRLPFDESRIERLLLAKQHKSNLIKSISSNISNPSVLNVQPTPAPQFAGLTNWINSSPQTIAGLHGKVVLVDFWTYSCINCIRSIPYVEKWYQTYQKDGLVVVGVNTPEFAFEHNPANVAAAVARDGITYPVALDNNYDTWNAFDNDSWPADYLIDKSGDIRYVSLGEGDYNKTEEAIQDLLGVKQKLQTPTSIVPISSNQTNETYFGTDRENAYVGSPEIKGGNASYSPLSSSSLQPGQWTLSGGWQVSGSSITSTRPNSTLTINFSAKNVYLVAGSDSNQPINVGVSLPASLNGQYGSDAPGGIASISGSKLYSIVGLKQFSSSILTLNVPSGVSLYTFTFGS